MHQLPNETQSEARERSKRRLFLQKQKRLIFCILESYFLSLHLHRKTTFLLFDICILWKYYISFCWTTSTVVWPFDKLKGSLGDPKIKCLSGFSFKIPPPTRHQIHQSPFFIFFTTDRVCQYMRNTAIQELRKTNSNREKIERYIRWPLQYNHVSFFSPQLVKISLSQWQDKKFKEKRFSQDGKSDQFSIQNGKLWNKFVKFHKFLKPTEPRLFYGIAFFLGQK